MKSSETFHQHVAVAREGMRLSDVTREGMAAAQDFGPLREIQDLAHAESSRTIAQAPDPSDLVRLLDDAYCPPTVAPLEVLRRFDSAVRSFIDDACGGSYVAFAAAWNALIGDPDFERAFFSMYRSMYSPVIDGNSSFAGSAAHILLTRHGKSVYDSKTLKVGCRTPNRSTPEGIALARTHAATFAQTLLESIDRGDLADNVSISTSESPNTAKELGPLFAEALESRGIPLTGPAVHPVNASQDFGVWTGLGKSAEKQLFAAVGLDSEILKHPLFLYPGGESFAIFLARYLALFEHVAAERTRIAHLLCTHSSSLQALVIGYHVRFSDLIHGVSRLRSHKESQDCVIGIGVDDWGFLSPYSAFTGNTAPLPPSETVEKRGKLEGTIRSVQGTPRHFALSVRQGIVGNAISILERSGRMESVRFLS